MMQANSHTYLARAAGGKLGELSGAVEVREAGRAVRDERLHGAVRGRDALQGHDRERVVRDRRRGRGGDEERGHEGGREREADHGGDGSRKEWRGVVEGATGVGGGIGELVCVRARRSRFMRAAPILRHVRRRLLAQPSRPPSTARRQRWSGGGAEAGLLRRPSIYSDTAGRRAGDVGVRYMSG
jgi:hypothetical protein